VTTAAQKWNARVEAVILDRLLAGEALNAICRDESIPVCESYVRKKAKEDDAFGAKYTRAREIGWQCRAERVVEDTKTADAKENPQAARLAFDAERWYLGKMLPMVFGDKTLVGSDPDNPLPTGFSVNLVKGGE
jgi:hypothetical protein